MLDQLQHRAHIQSFVHCWILAKVCFGEPEQSCRRTQACLLQVNECSRQLDQSLVKCKIRAGAVLQPKFFQDVMSLKEQLSIEAFEIAKIVRVAASSLTRPNQFCYGCALLAHA